MENERILLGHGSGGQLMHELVSEIIGPALGAETADDGARLGIPPADSAELVVTTDSYVVSPLFFPGGSIGHLAVHGTVNDLAMMLARPMYLTVGLILEEGLEIATLRRILDDMADAATGSGVRIVAGDTKVVERGSADGMFINTAGIGFKTSGADVAGNMARPGDVIIVSGPIGDHGTAVMADRAGLTFDPPVNSDTAPLGTLVEAMKNAVPDGAIHTLRDPTRGGLATTLCEIAEASGVGIRIDESRIPVRDTVRGACDLLGLDPLYVANEGRLVAFVAEQSADTVVTAMRTVAEGVDACIIGRAGAESPGQVVLDTLVGGSRLVYMLRGEQLPRIC